MKPVFRDHTVICGWNVRGPTVVEALQAFGKRPIVVINKDVSQIITQVGNRPNVFAIAGESSDRDVLMSADITTARSVLVLSDDALGSSADARSVQIALAVEKIQVSVYTVVEIRDLQNKVHFAWTKVDDLVTEQELSMRMIAQAIRHIVSEQGKVGAEVLAHEKLVLQVYRQLVSPHHDKSQLFRVNADWEKVKSLTFLDLLREGLKLGVLVVAPAGYHEHKIGQRPGQQEWNSWKGEVKTNPSPKKRMEDIWPLWPKGGKLGLICLAKTLEQALSLPARLERMSSNFERIEGAEIGVMQP